MRIPQYDRVTEIDSDDLFVIDGLSGTKSISFETIFDGLYPLNSVYISMSNVNPSTYWTWTTWELLSDGYLRNNAANDTGGSLTSGSTTLTTNQIPSHSHTITTGKYGDHTHTATTQNIGAHTHTAKTGSYGAHTHTVYWKTNETIYFLSNYAKSGGTVATIVPTANTSYHDNMPYAGSAGAHTHTLTTASYGNHTHTLTTQNTGAHTHTGATQAIGGGKGHTHSIEPSYVRIYAFKRTA